MQLEQLGGGRIIVGQAQFFLQATTFDELRTAGAA